jgi:WD40 repeat protein
MLRHKLLLFTTMTRNRAREDGSEVAVGTSTGVGTGAGGAEIGDEEWLVIQGSHRTLQFWDANTCIHVKSLPTPAEAHWFGFSPDNRLLSVAFRERHHQNAQLWDVSTSTVRLEWEIPESYGTATVAMNCQMTKIATKSRAAYRKYESPSCIITVWDFISRTVAFTIEIRAYDTETLYFSMNGSDLLLDVCASVDTDAQTLLTAWDADTGTQTHQLEVGNVKDFDCGVICVALSPSGELAAIGSEDKRVVVVALHNWTQRACLTTHTDFICSVAFSSDSGRLVTGSFDNLIIVWSTESWTELVRIDVYKEVHSTAISPSANRIACVSVKYDLDTLIPQIFDASTGNFLCSTASVVGAGICYSNPQMSILL